MVISVIIPTYNEAFYIARCLASLQKQQLDIHDQLEVIVIDDGSTDRTVTKIKQFPKVKLLHQDHAGPANARNTAARHARGDILVFVDADMEFDPKFIKYLIQPIKAKSTKGTFSKQEYVANWENPIARCWNWNNNLPAKYRLHLDHPDVGTDFRAILHSEFNKVNGFDNTGYTDTWTLPRKLKYQPTNAPGAIFYHHNPATLIESFNHARWVSKREYKLGFTGKLVAIARASLPVSLIVGIIKAAKHLEPMFLPYKIVWDFGTTLGILHLIFTGNTAK